MIFDPDSEETARLLHAFLDEDSHEGERLRRAYARLMEADTEASEVDERARAAVADARLRRREGPWWSRVVTAVLVPRAPLEFAVAPGRLSAATSGGSKASFALPPEIASRFRGRMEMEAKGKGDRRSVTIRLPSLVEPPEDGERPLFDVQIEENREDGSRVVLLSLSLKPGERSDPVEMAWGEGDWLVRVESSNGDV